jgi:hypothetical protein
VSASGAASTPQGIRDPATLRKALINRAFHPGEGFRANSRQYGWILDCREVALVADALPAAGRLMYGLLAAFRPRAVVSTDLSRRPTMCGSPRSPPGSTCRRLVFRGC